MWNLYDIEKKFEAHVKDVEERSRKAHWYTERGENGLRPGVVASWVSLFAVRHCPGLSRFMNSFEIR